MAAYTRKKVNVFFDFDSEGNLIPNSQFLGVTYFDENNEKLEIEGKPGSVAVNYAQMTEDQKVAFDDLVTAYLNLKDQK